MPIKSILYERGKVNLGQKFLSLRLLKEALEKNHKIVVLQETPKFLKCRVIRILRLFGAPWIGPHPILQFKIENENGDTILLYEFFWPEFYVVGLASIVMGIASAAYLNGLSLLFKLKIGIVSFLVCLMFFGLLTLLDVKYFSKKVQSTLSKL